ncbi:MAG: helix-turn-helix transcriptional regulator [Pseudomonadota bacterium]
MLTADQLTRLCTARERLRDIDDTALTIDEIAASAAMSRYHFVRQFKALFGETPVHCRTGARLERAKRLLLQSELSVTEICMAVGFSSLGSFSALFSERFGRSPSEYRQTLNGRDDVAAPHCMTLMNAAWAVQAQKTRSEGSSD